LAQAEQEARASCVMRVASPAGAQQRSRECGGGGLMGGSVGWRIHASPPAKLPPGVVIL